ncbi:hypothetical protein [Streptomyces sp. NPDC050504]|uniref:hypothetical protein n=1 Tax=Streptomyces sp. NPDC050504 TaxID=3365618 RepID=UPI00378FA21E
MIRVLRLAAYAVLPGELVLVMCLVAGVRIPGGFLVAAELLIGALFLAELWAFQRLRRRLGGARAALAELVPRPVRALVGHELRLLVSLALWVARRRHGVRPGSRAFGHARDQAATMYGFAFVCAVETAGMSYLLKGLPAVHAVVLVLDVYTVLFVLGLHAASVVRPHVLGGGALRLRQAGHVDVTVPLGLVEDVRYEPLFTHRAKEGELNLAVGSQTSLTLRLREPLDVPTLLGRARPVHTLRCHADDARALYAALKDAVADPFTPGRTAPSAPPDPPA